MMRIVRTAALLVAVLLSARVAPARAEDVADEAQFHFERGNQFYAQARFDDALAAYYASNRLVSNRNVQFNIGRCLERMRRYEEAFRAWAALDGPKLPEAEREAVRAAIDRLRPNVALVSVDSDPPGANIFIDRRDLGALGQTPKRLALREGKATIILDRPGFRPVEVSVAMQKGQEARVAPALARIYGRLDLRRLPPDGVVRSDLVDGEVLRRGPGAVQLAPGRRVLFVSAPGHQIARVDAEIFGDRTTTVDVPLSPEAPALGAIVVHANVDGALVRMDGEEVGFTPTVLESIRAGERKIEISQEGRKSYSAVVPLRAGERVYLDVRLGREDPQVVAATKDLVRSEQAPASVTVVTAEDIAGFGWTTIAEALAGVRGVFASNDRSYESIGFRGFSPPGDYTNRVLVLVDGHPYNDVVTGQGFVGHDLDVDLANVVRIEVVRGPGSVLYGTGALFGVINVVTRAAARAGEGEVDAHAGTLGTQSGRATAGGRRGPVSVLASAAALNQIGDRQFPVDPAGDIIASRADLERAWHADLVARAGWLSLRAGANDREKTIPTGAFETRAGPGTTYRDTRLYAELRAERPIGAVQLSARAAYDASRFRGHYVLTAEPDGTPRADLDDRFTAQWLTGELRAVLPPVVGQRLTVGGEAQRQFQLDLGGPSRAAQRDAGSEHELVLSAYAVDDWQIASWLRLDAGLRADRYVRSFGTTVNPRAALIARLYEGGNTKLFVGRAFRAPSPYERFYNDGGVTQRRAGDLAPELLLSADLEHAHTIGEDVTVVGNAFSSEVSNLIVLDAEGSGGGLLSYRNHPYKVRSLGVGGELRWEPGAGTSLVATYGWQRVRSDTETGSQPFLNAPRQTAALRALAPIVGGAVRLGNELLLDLGRRTRDGVRVDDAVIWNLVVSGQPRHGRLRYYAGLYNLLDVRGHGTGFPVGDEVPAATVPRYGRTVRAGVALSF